VTGTISSEGFDPDVTCLAEIEPVTDVSLPIFNSFS